MAPLFPSLHSCMSRRSDLGQVPLRHVPAQADGRRTDGRTYGRTDGRTPVRSFTPLHRARNPSSWVNFRTRGPRELERFALAGGPRFLFPGRAPRPLRQSGSRGAQLGPAIVRRRSPPRPGHRHGRLVGLTRISFLRFASGLFVVAVDFRPHPRGRRTASRFSLR